MVAKSMDLSWIVVSDLKKALEFYTEVMGLKLVELQEQFGWAELQGKEGGMRLGIAQASPHEPEAGKNAVVTMTVDNLERAKSYIEKNGALFIGDVLEIPDQVKMQTFADVDGNRFQIVQILSGE